MYTIQIEGYTARPANVDVKAPTRIRNKAKASIAKWEKAAFAYHTKAIKVEVAANRFIAYDTVKAFTASAKAVATMRKNASTRIQRGTSAKVGEINRAKLAGAKLVNSSYSYGDVKVDRAIGDVMSKLRTFGEVGKLVDFDSLADAVQLSLGSAHTAYRNAISAVFAPERMYQYVQESTTAMLRTIAEPGRSSRNDVINSASDALFNTVMVNKIGDVLVANAQFTDKGNVRDSEMWASKARTAVLKFEKNLSAQPERNAPNWLAWTLTNLTGKSVKKVNGNEVAVAPISYRDANRLSGLIYSALLDTQGVTINDTFVGNFVESTRTAKNGDTLTSVDFATSALRAEVDAELQASAPRRTNCVFLEPIPAVNAGFVLGSSADKVMGGEVSMVIGDNATSYGDASRVTDAINALNATELRVDNSYTSVADIFAAGLKAGRAAK